MSILWFDFRTVPPLIYTQLTKMHFSAWRELNYFPTLHRNDINNLLRSLIKKFP